LFTRGHSCMSQMNHVCSSPANLSFLLWNTLQIAAPTVKMSSSLWEKSVMTQREWWRVRRQCNERCKCLGCNTEPGRTRFDGRIRAWMNTTSSFRERRERRYKSVMRGHIDPFIMFTGEGVIASCDCCTSNGSMFHIVLTCLCPSLYSDHDSWWPRIVKWREPLLTMTISKMLS
jgi:uncharacterized short protein YbdD (DUF466 family)